MLAVIQTQAVVGMEVQEAQEPQEAQERLLTKRKDSEKPDRQPRVDYQEKNLDHIEKIKERKQREVEEKEKEMKRDQELKDKLKKKILAEAQRVKEQKEKENSRGEREPETPPTIKSRRQAGESLPKVSGVEKDMNRDNKEKFKKRHSQFLNSLTSGLKAKKDLEETDKRKKEERYEKLREEMGINKIESKLVRILEESREPPRPCSADKVEFTNPLSETQTHQYSATSSKSFQDKHSEYLENIRKKKVSELQRKEDEEKKIEKRKEKLRDYVMITVKKNVQEGVYETDDEEGKKGTKRKVDDQNDYEQIEEEDDQTSENEDEVSVEKPKKQRKMRALPHVVDIVEWRKKNRLQPETLVFIITGGYSDIKKALRARGWVQNPDSCSPCFDMKWVLQSRECEYGSLQDNQIVNHFEKNGVITTKIGLCKNLRGLKWINNVDVDDFLPKCFDLCDDEDLTAFEEEFKLCKAMTILKLYMKLASLKSFPEIEKIKERAKVANEVLNRNMISLDDLIDRKKFPEIVSPKEWEVLAEGELNLEGLAKKKHEEWLLAINAKYNDTKDQEKKKKKKKKNKEQAHDKETEEKEEYNDEFTKEVDATLSKYEEMYPQYNLTNTNNIWILKPAGLSRGRGITCYNSLVEIQDHIKSKELQWVAQKYIENPLIVCKRKFDIRQWVLVTSFNPLTIWKYEECYIRFSALDYNVEDVSNKFIHLTNNSIGALHKGFDKSEIKGNMYSQDQFKDFIKEKEGSDVFEEKIRGEMASIIKWSMEAAQEGIEHRKNSHELFGYDFMVDEDYKVWLIEVNSSPSMDYSTHITARLVKSCLEDVVKVVVDYNSAPKKERKRVDTGGFKLIYKGPEIPDKPITTGLNLGIEGVQLKKGPGKKAVIRTSSSIKVQNNPR